MKSPASTQCTRCSAPSLAECARSCSACRVSSAAQCPADPPASARDPSARPLCGTTRTRAPGHRARAAAGQPAARRPARRQCWPRRAAWPCTVGRACDLWATGWEEINVVKLSDFICWNQWSSGKSRVLHWWIYYQTKQTISSFCGQSGCPLVIKNPNCI